MTVPVAGATPDPAEVVRPLYSDGQYLSASDFDVALDYARRGLGRHELGSHTFGLIVGLDLVEVADASDATLVDAFLTPGMAVDGYGRQIVSFSRIPIDTSLFDAFVDQAHRSVWIEFDETTATAAGPGYADCGSGGPTRVVEGFKLLVDPTVTTVPVMVDGEEAIAEPAAGASIPADESVPFQQLPAEPPLARWPLRLGTLRWDGGVRRFRPAGDRLAEGREYAGVVAADVLAPASTLRVAPRTAATDPDAADFAKVEGRLRVTGRINAEKEVWLEGDPIRFTLDAGGGDTEVPMTLVRDDGVAPVTHRLRLGLGLTPSADTALSIGTHDDESTTDPVTEVRMDGRVRIPHGPLDLGNLAHRQKIVLHDPTYGVGSQPDTVYLRSPRQFAWFAGGSHKDTALDPGTGGTLLLELDEQGALQFGTTTHQMLNLWSTSYGIGIQDWTLYSRTDGDFCWFRGGVHADARSSPGGGVLAMKLDSTGLLTVFGPAATTGDLTVGTGSDAVVHTRHVTGKQVGADAADNLYLQWNTGLNVVVGGGGQASSLDVTGGLTVRQSGESAVDTVVKVVTRDVTVVNGFNGTRGLPGTWNCTWSGDLDEVYAVFATVTGFSTVETSMSDNPPRTDVGCIEAWVIVDGHSNTSAWGRALCAQGDGTLESNNSTAITVVAIGRKLS